MGSGSEECECEESVGRQSVGRELWGGKECGEGRECECKDTVEKCGKV